MLIIILSVLAIQYTLKPNTFFIYNPLEVLITCGPIISYSIMHLYNSLTKKGSFMYINTGILFYLSFTTLVFILFDLINSTNIGINRKPILFINKVLIISNMILFIIEFKNIVWKKISK